MKRRFKVSGYSGSIRLMIRLSGLSSCLACWAWTRPDDTMTHSPAKNNEATVFSGQVLVFRRLGISREPRDQTHGNTTLNSYISCVLRSRTNIQEPSAVRPLHGPNGPGYRSI